MAVKIKLTRIGKRNDPKYRIVVMEEGKKRDGKYIDKIGFYDPIANPSILKIDKDKLNKWVKNGAQLAHGAKKILWKILSHS